MYCELKYMTYEAGPYPYGVSCKLKVDGVLYFSLAVGEDPSELIERVIGMNLAKAGRLDIPISEVWVKADIQDELL